MGSIARTAAVVLLCVGTTAAVAKQEPPAAPRVLRPAGVSRPTIALTVARPMAASDWLAIASAVGIPESSPELKELIDRYRAESDALVAASTPTEALAVAAAGTHGRLNMYIRGGAARAELALQEQRFDDSLRRLEASTLDALAALCGPGHDATIARLRDRRTRERCEAVHATYPGANVRLDEWLALLPPNGRFVPPAEHAAAWAQAILDNAAASAADDEFRVEAWRRGIVANATLDAETETLDDSGVSDEQFTQRIRANSTRRDELLGPARTREKTIAERNESTIETLAGMLPEGDRERLRDAYLNAITPNLSPDPLLVEASIAEAVRGLDATRDAATIAAVAQALDRYRSLATPAMRTIRTQAVGWRRAIAMTGRYRATDRQAVVDRITPEFAAIARHAKTVLEEVAALLAPIAEDAATQLRRVRGRIDREAEQQAKWSL